MKFSTLLSCCLVCFIMIVCIAPLTHDWLIRSLQEFLLKRPVHVYTDWISPHTSGVSGHNLFIFPPGQIKHSSRSLIFIWPCPSWKWWRTRRAFVPPMTQFHNWTNPSLQWLPIRIMGHRDPSPCGVITSLSIFGYFSSCCQNLVRIHLISISLKGAS